jgi:hypothetical protein
VLAIIEHAQVRRKDATQLMTAEIRDTEAVSYYAPGETPQGPFGAGDFYLTSSGRIGSRIIQSWQTRRYKGDESAYAKWNHAGLFLGEGGLIAEALGSGVVARDISAYTEPRVAVIRPPEMAELDRGQIRRFADAVVEVRYEYSYETLLAIALQLSTGSRFGFARASTAICSGFVAEALTRAGYIFERPPSFTMPDDLAKLFGVAYPY